MMTDWLQAPCDKPTCRALVGQKCKTNTGSVLPVVESHVSRRRNYYAQFPHELPEFHPLRRHHSDARPKKGAPSMPSPDISAEDQLATRRTALSEAIRAAGLSTVTFTSITELAEEFETYLAGGDSSLKTQIREILSDSGLWDDGAEGAKDPTAVLDQIRRLVDF